MKLLKNKKFIFIKKSTAFLLLLTILLTMFLGIGVQANTILQNNASITPVFAIRAPWNLAGHLTDAINSISAWLLGGDKNSISIGEPVKRVILEDQSLAGMLQGNDNNFQKWFNIFQIAGMAFLPLILVKVAIMYIGSFVNMSPGDRGDLKDFVKYAILYIALLIFAKQLILWAVQLNDAIVLLFKDPAAALGVSVDSGLGSGLSESTLAEEASTLGSAILTLIVVGYAWVLSIYIQLIFFVRKVIVAFAYMLIPVAGILMFVKKFRGVIGKLYEELLAVIFQQAVYAGTFVLLYDVMLQVLKYTKFAFQNADEQGSIDGYLQAMFAHDEVLGPLGWALLLYMLLRVAKALISLFSLQTAHLTPDVKDIASKAAFDFKKLGETSSLLSAGKSGKNGPEGKNIEGNSKKAENAFKGKKGIKDKLSKNIMGQALLNKPKVNKLANKANNAWDKANKGYKNIKQSWKDGIEEKQDLAKGGHMGWASLITAGGVAKNVGKLGIAAAKLPVYGGYVALNETLGFETVNDVVEGFRYFKRAVTLPKPMKKGDEQSPLKGEFDSDVPFDIVRKLGLTQRDELVEYKDKDGNRIFGKKNGTEFVKLGKDGEVEPVYFKNDSERNKLEMVAEYKGYTHKTDGQTTLKYHNKSPQIPEVSGRGIGNISEAQIDREKATSLENCDFIEDPKSKQLVIDYINKNKDKNAVVMVVDNVAGVYGCKNGDVKHRELITTLGKVEGVGEGDVALATIQVDPDNSNNILVGELRKVDDDSDSMKVRRFVTLNDRRNTTRANIRDLKIKENEITETKDPQIIDYMSNIQKGEVLVEVVDNNSRKFVAIEENNPTAVGRVIATLPPTGEDYKEMQYKVYKINSNDTSKVITHDEPKKYHTSLAAISFNDINYTNAESRRSRTPINKPIEINEIPINYSYNQEMNNMAENESQFITVVSNGIETISSFVDKQGIQHIVGAQYHNHLGQDTFLEGAYNDQQVMKISTVRCTKRNGQIEFEVVHDFEDCNEIDMQGLEKAISDNISKVKGLRSQAFLERERAKEELEVLLYNLEGAAEEQKTAMNQHIERLNNQIDAASNVISSIEEGLRQGESLSPLLTNLYEDMVGSNDSFDSEQKSKATSEEIARMITERRGELSRLQKMINDNINAIQRARNSNEEELEEILNGKLKELQSDKAKADNEVEKLLVELGNFKKRRSKVIGAVDDNKEVDDNEYADFWTSWFKNNEIE